LNDKVCKYWPEFAQNGKENLTISQILRHEAGLNTFSEQVPVEYTHTENIKANKIGRIIEKEK
jgi:CubicO group peptidase (beta-lactamase class C family)